jgi:hypothetical protein
MRWQALWDLLLIANNFPILHTVPALPLEGRPSNAGLCPERLPQPLPSHGQVLREHARFCDYRHEVGIAGPAWQGVEVQVLSDSGAGCLAKIQAHIEPMGMVNRIQSPL